MTLKELYQNIDGDFEQASRVLRVEKLIDKHIRKFAENPVFDRLFAAEETMDATELFESTHAIKGVCGNLGLTGLAALASDVTEEFRPGNTRKLSDEEVKGKLAQIKELYNKTVEGIKAYEEA